MRPNIGMELARIRAESLRSSGTSGPRARHRLRTAIGRRLVGTGARLLDAGRRDELVAIAGRSAS